MSQKILAGIWIPENYAWIWACYLSTTGSFIETGLPSECKSCNLFMVNSLLIRALTAGSFIKTASAQDPKNASPLYSTQILA